MTQTLQSLVKLITLSMLVSACSDEKITPPRPETETQATDGVGTGMKWLSEKTNCLTIQSGEGFCRDE